MKKYYRGSYGCSASIGSSRDGQFRLRIRLGNGRLAVNKAYKTERGARIAMGKFGDGWELAG